MEKSDKTSTITVLSILVALISISIFGFVHYNYTGSQPEPQVKGESVVVDKIQIAEYKLQLRDVTGQRSFDAQFEEGQSLFEALKELDSKETGFSLGYKDSSYGAFITSVNGVEADPLKEFWKIEINGTDAQVGMSDYTLKAGDRITLMLEEIEY